jgi:hypothetical protein
MLIAHVRARPESLNALPAAILQDRAILLANSSASPRLGGGRPDSPSGEERRRAAGGEFANSIGRFPRVARARLGGALPTPSSCSFGCAAPRTLASDSWVRGRGALSWRCPGIVTWGSQHVGALAIGLAVRTGNLLTRAYLPRMGTETPHLQWQCSPSPPRWSTGIGPAAPSSTLGTEHHRAESAATRVGGARPLARRERLPGQRFIAVAAESLGGGALASHQSGGMLGASGPATWRAWLRPVVPAKAGRSGRR